ncbi:hypothetical protein [Microbacterium sp. MMO-10]|uniref:hypothetical protein n=1 Tax=Microbacterium sp. MMO-10 TaxID=3081272 RepID=UPI003019808A
MSKAPFKFDRLEPNIFLREAPVNRPPKRLIPERRGQQFIPHGTDSVGTIVSDPRRNRKTVQFRYAHDPDSLYEMNAHEFNDRFARLLPPVRAVTVKFRVSMGKFMRAVHQAKTATEALAVAIDRQTVGAA